MIVDKTAAEQQREREIMNDYSQKFDIISQQMQTATGEEYACLLKTADKLQIEFLNKTAALDEECSIRAFNEIEQNPSAIISNARKQVPLIIKYYYDRYEGRNKEELEQLKCGTIIDGKRLLNEAYIRPLIKGHLQLHFAAVQGNAPALQRLKNAINQKIASSSYLINDPAIFAPFDPFSVENMLTTTGIGGRLLARFNEAKAETVKGSNTILIKTKAGGQIAKTTISDKVKVPSVIPNILGDKLYSAAVALFTQNNNNDPKAPIDLTVQFSFREFARRVSDKVIANAGGSSEDAAKERARAKSSLDKLRRDVNKQLFLLATMNVYAAEMVSQNVPDGYIPLFSFAALPKRSDTITISFNPILGEYLKKTPTLGRYSTALLAIDTRKAKAYWVGRKIIDHFYMYENQTKGTANRLKVKTLLEAGGFPSKNDLANEQKNDGRHWDRRIKDPLEEALEYLCKVKLLKNWQYVGKNDIPLTDEEARRLVYDYQVFLDTNIRYDLANPEDQAEQLIRYEAEKERRQAAAEAKREKKTQKSGKK